MEVRRYAQEEGVIRKNEATQIREVRENVENDQRETCILGLEVEFERRHQVHGGGI